MDLRGRFSRKNAEDGEDRSRRHRLRNSRANPGEGHSGSLDASWLSPLSRQSSAASATYASRQSPSHSTLTRHRSVHSDGRSEERRSFTQRLGIFRPLSANASRTSSTNTSSSSLLSLADQSVASETAPDGTGNSYTPGHSHSSSTARGSDPTHPPLSPLSEIPSRNSQRPDDRPVYPDQSYAVLQRQVHPTYRPSLDLRSRSSYPSHYHLSMSRGVGSTWNRGSADLSQTALTAGNTPLSSPGLFSPHAERPAMWTPPKRQSSQQETPFPKPKETHTAELDVDQQTGNKRINDYEILEELGRGEHGKVKLGRHIGTGQQVAIKIVQRYSKRRRLGRLGNPEDKVKKEVAILKKARHPNVVSLLEVIDDPKQQKVYIVLEYVENGEIVWQTRGRREIAAVEKKRLAREKLGIPDSPSFLEESQQLVKNTQIRRQRRQAALKRQRERAAISFASGLHAWSLEHGAVSDDESALESLDLHPTVSRTTQDRLEGASQPSSFTSASELDRRFRDPSLAAVEGSMYGPYSTTDTQLERRCSTASSNFYQSEPDWLSDDDDSGFVPVLTIPEARGAFRDAVLGLEYLHYQGIIHRDIKPANLLLTAGHQVKISDFGVSYLGRPLRDSDEEQVEETDATELDDARELSKTVGTPAFYAPELCYTGSDFEKVIGSVPKITGAIDVWSLGVTLYAMIFGRLPFVGDDEFGLFHIIVHNPVFIPTKRLKAVETDPPPTPASSHRIPVMNSNKRTEDELVYEDVDDELRDLLLRLLEKDPTKRITLKEIKHHPWVLHGLPDPYAWPEETDPAYQSKGKKIEVSNEEVAQAVAKMSIFQKINSQFSKMSSKMFGKGEKSSAANTSSHSTSSSNATLGKESGRLSRRLSLRRDGEPRTPKPIREREGEHPLSQSVVPSPEPKDDGDYFGTSTVTSTSTATANTPSKLAQRPGMPARATSTVSTAGSSKTVRPNIVPPDSRSRRPGSTEPQSSSSAIGSMVEASRRLVQSLNFSERRERSPISVRSFDGDTHSQPSVALSDTTVTGQIQSAETLRDSSLDTITRTTSRDTARAFVSTPHRRSKSYHEVQGPYSAHLLNSSPTPQQHHHNASGGSVRKEQPGEQVDRDQIYEPRTGPMTSLPSAVIVSSSSAEDFTSGMSHCASHPSIPSVDSGASSFSGDCHKHVHTINLNKDAETTFSQEDIPPLLRTEETVTSQNPRDNASGDKAHEDYDCDDEDESSEDECLSFGRPKPCQKDASKP